MIPITIIIIICTNEISFCRGSPAAWWVLPLNIHPIPCCGPLGKYYIHSMKSNIVLQLSVFGGYRISTKSICFDLLSWQRKVSIIARHSEEHSAPQSSWVIDCGSKRCRVFIGSIMHSTKCIIDCSRYSTKYCYARCIHQSQLRCSSFTNNLETKHQPTTTNESTTKSGPRKTATNSVTLEYTGEFLENHNC